MEPANEQDHQQLLNERRSTRVAAQKSQPFKLNETISEEESDNSCKNSESEYKPLCHPAHETDGYQFTVSAIANALGMHKEEKTISRVLHEIRKVHSSTIKQLNVRNGKIF